MSHLPGEMFPNRLEQDLNQIDERLAYVQRLMEQFEDRVVPDAGAAVDAQAVDPPPEATTRPAQSEIEREFASRTEIIVIDAAVTDADALPADILEQRANKSLEVRLLDPDRDGVEHRNATSAEGTAMEFDGQGIGTIVDGSIGTDDDRPSFSVGDVTVIEGTDPYAVFSVVLSNRSVEGIKFSLSVVGGSAAGGGVDFGAGLEYFDGSSWQTVSGPVAISSGNLVLQVRTPIIDDALADDGEQFTLAATRSSGTTLNASDLGTGIIQDELPGDTALVSMTGPAGVTEGDTTTPYTVSIDLTPSSFNNLSQPKPEPRFDLPRDVLLSETISELAAQPILAGYAKSGTLLMARLYGPDGSILAESTTTVDAAGNWILEFQNVEATVETRVVIEHVASEAVALGSAQFRLTPDTYRSMQLSTYHQRAMTVGSILGDAP